MARRFRGNPNGRPQSLRRIATDLAERARRQPMGSAVLLTFVIPTRARHTVGPQRGMGSMISMAVKLDNGMSKIIPWLLRRLARVKML
jgi:hypothetical protein